MNVCIINQELNHSKTYQIMQQSGNGFIHVFPGKLFTSEEVNAICKTNKYNIVAIGTMWKCIK